MEVSAAQPQHALHHAVPWPPSDPRPAAKPNYTKPHFVIAPQLPPVIWSQKLHAINLARAFHHAPLSPSSIQNFRLAPALPLQPMHCWDVEAILDSVDMVVDTPPALVPTELSRADLAKVDTMVVRTNKFCESAGLFNPSLYVTPAQQQLVLAEAFEAADEMFGVRAAQEFGADFPEWPRAVEDRDDTTMAMYSNDFQRACAEHQRQRAHNRLSEGRIRQVVPPNDPDFERLLKIAAGIHITLPNDFVPRSDRPMMRKRYLQVAGAVNKLLYKQWLVGTVMILPTLLLTQVPGIHFSPQHWTTKAGKACGRVVCDTANGDNEDFVPVNGRGEDDKEQLRVSLIEEWGPIKHPTVTDLALMLWSETTKHGADNLELWKLDLAGAFNLMSFHPSSAQLLAFELTGGMSVVHVTGMFGWAGTPYCFQVVTRVLSRLCTLPGRGGGRCLWYVDDCMGISLRSELAQDVERTVETIEALLGTGAVAPDKHDRGRRLVCIGWCFDLDTMTVTISRRNLLKGLYSFFSFDLDSKVTLHLVERMASLASRYAMLCPQMKPFTSQLYKLIPGYDGNHSKLRTLSLIARVDVVMWRSFLCLLHFEEARFARSLSSFVPHPATVLFGYDASLTGFGAGVSTFNSVTSKWEVIAYARLPMPYPVDANDSAFQNTNEYLGIMLCLLLVKQTGCVAKGFTFNVVGDNTTSLAWCRNERVNSILARRANIGFSLLAVDLDASVADTEHIAGVDNTVFDGLSRGKTGPEVGLPADSEVVLTPDCLAIRYIMLCNPNNILVGIENHTTLAVDLLAVLGSTDEHGDGPHRL
jgi:hypothetical protein